MSANEWLQNLSRIDFVTSVGLHVMHDRLILVRLRKSFQTVKLLEQEACEMPEADGKQDISGLTGWIPDDVREIALKAEHDSSERALRQAILSLIPHFNASRDAVYICVPQDQAIVQQIYLPEAAETNLAQVLDYEIERTCLFAATTFTSIIAHRSKGRQTRRLYLRFRNALATLLEVLASFGVKPKGVETTVTAWPISCSSATAHSPKRAPLSAVTITRWNLWGAKPRQRLDANPGNLIFQFGGAPRRLGGGAVTTYFAMHQATRSITAGSR